ncbi:MAG: CYTH domain-containing protein [Magnetococcales bacterium]|nr:CYTH domain-containing protein [Magnetococcales bacterium]
MALEEEIKLTVPAAGILEAVLADPEVQRRAIGPLRLRPFLAIYYDTPHQDLLAQCLAFRARRVAGQWWAGLKGQGRVVDGVSQREEWEARFPGPIERFGQLPPGELRERVLAIVAAEQPLEKLLTTDITRRVLDLELEEGSRVELALDQGLIEAGGRQREILEVELERLSGPLEPLIRFGRELAHRHHLTPARLSKYHQGLELLGLLTVEAGKRLASVEGGFLHPSKVG